MARHSGPTRFQLSSPAARRYSNAGRKLLGELDARVKAGDLGQLTLRRVLADGATVVASIAGSQQVIELTAPEDIGGVRRPSTIQGLLLGGIAARPRNAGTTGSTSDGQNAFGQFSHVILNGRPGELPSDPSQWRALYYNATTKPTGESGGFYETNRKNESLFFDGITGSGTDYWTNLDGSLSVSWNGQRGRGVPMDMVNNGERVYHNGVILLDTNTLPVGQRKIMCAAIRSFDGVNYLLVATSASGTALRIFRCRLHPDDVVTDSPSTDPAFAWVAEAKRYVPVSDLHWPRWKKIIAAECENILTFSEPLEEFESGTYAYGLMTFNQSATELRSILPILAFGDIDGSGEIRSWWNLHELVVDLTTPELGSVITTYISRGLIRVTEYTRNINTSYAANVANVIVAEHTSTVPDPPVAGSFVRSTVYKWSLANFQDATSSTSDAVIIARGTRYEYEKLSEGGDVPILVDYQDDVPVYLYWGFGSVATFDNCSINFSNAETFAETKTDVYTGSPASFDHTDTVSHKVEHADVSSTASSGSTGSENHFYAIDKDGVRWFDMQEQLSSSGASEITGSMDTMVDINAGVTTKTTDFQTSRSDSVTGTRDMIGLWFVDLRSKSIVATLSNATANGTLSTEGSASGTTNPLTVSYVTAEQVDTVHTFRTEVWFYGVKVREFNSTHTPAPTVNNSSTSSSQTVSYKYLFDNASAAATRATGASFPLDAMGSSATRWILNSGIAGQWTEAVALYASLTASWTDAAPYDQSLTGSIDDQNTEFTNKHDYDEFFNYHISFSSGSITIGEPFRAIARVTVGGFFGLAVDAETQAGDGAAQNSLFATSDGYGRFIAFNGQWLYSMFDLDGRTELDTHQWKVEAGVIDRDHPEDFNAGSIVSLDSISGNQGAQLFSAMWPVSECVAQFQTIP